jgi:hypothetical protein
MSASSRGMYWTGGYFDSIERHGARGIRDDSSCAIYKHMNPCHRRDNGVIDIGQQRSGKALRAWTIDCHRATEHRKRSRGKRLAILRITERWALILRPSTAFSIRVHRFGRIVALVRTLRLLNAGLSEVRSGRYWQITTSEKSLRTTYGLTGPGAVQADASVLDTSQCTLTR